MDIVAKNTMLNGVYENNHYPVILFASSVHSEELPIFFDSGIDTYILESQDSTLMLLKDKKPNLDFGFNTYKFKLEDAHLIQFIVHPENLKYEVSEIKIIKGKNGDHSHLYPGKAITQKAISLGISKEDLISKIGKPKVATGNQYEYRTENHKGILKTYNMPIYYGKYKFVKNRLVSFSFGFEYL